MSSLLGNIGVSGTTVQTISGVVTVPAGVVGADRIIFPWAPNRTFRDCLKSAEWLVPADSAEGESLHRVPGDECITHGADVVDADEVNVLRGKRQRDSDRTRQAFFYVPTENLREEPLTRMTNQ